MHKAINVEPNPSEISQPQHTEAKPVDVWLKSLWDRAKKAAELIARLRQEKAELESRVATMEDELGRLRQESARNEEQIRTLTAAHGEAADHSLITNGEKEMLTARVKELLARLEGYV
jgi:chromosome segregation ATPase